MRHFRVGCRPDVATSNNPQSARLKIDKDQQDDQQGSGAGIRRPNLGLFVPPQAPPPPDSFLHDSRETEAWFHALPMANVGETARRIYSTLVDFNRMAFPPLLRARNAEKFREPVDYICNNLRRHFIDTGFPLSEKGRKAAALARALYHEIAISYKAIVLDLLAESGERFDRKLLVIALHRALRYLHQVMYYTSLVYAPWPQGLWREINAIYAYGSQNRIHQIQVKEGEGRQASQTTLEGVYLACLLFATATPNRLRQGQQLALIAELPKWTAHVSLGLPDEGDTGAGRYLVDLFSDSPPIQQDIDAPAANRRLRRLDLRPLLKHLHQRFDETPWSGGAGADTKGHTLNRPLLRALILSWSTHHERRFVRTRLSFELNVVTGLHRLHDHLLRSSQEQEVDSDTSERYNSRFLRHQDTTPIDPWSEPFSHGLTPARVEAEAVPESLFTDGMFSSVLSDSSPTSALTPPRAGESVRTLNESAGGYCIQWQGEKLPKIRVGELLGIQNQTGEGVFSLGVVRWLQQDNNQPLHFGVELIAPQCRAGDVAPYGTSRAQYQIATQRCLVIPRTMPSEPGDSLILPSALFAVGTTLRLNLEGGRQNIRLTGVMETTGAFARYQYETEQPKNKTSQTPDGDHDFGDLWNNL